MPLPYARFSPECCLVAEDRQGVAGYILGAVDTRAFEALLGGEVVADACGRSTPIP